MQIPQIPHTFAAKSSTKNLLHNYTTMATFKAEVYAHHRKQDGTYNIKIRVIHNKKKRYIPTVWYVEARDLTRSMKLKNQRFIDYTNDLIRTYRERCDRVGQALKYMSIEEVVAIITAEENNRFHLDFIEYCYQECAKMVEDGRQNSAWHYKTAVKHLSEYVGGSIDINDITASLLSDWAKSMIGQGRKNNYMAFEYPRLLSTFFDRAKRQYNDEEQGKIRIPYSPFVRMTKHPKPIAEKRAITVEQLRAIAALERDYSDDRRGNVNRRALAIDLFILSFGLIGMNMADLYTCTDYKDGRITYQRSKTRGRRADRAEISVKVEDEILPILERYRDTSGQRVFDFYRRYKHCQSMTSCINGELKNIGNEVGVEDLQFYSARHTWATIAVNEAGVDKYTVHQALNHVDPSMRVTDIYIRKSYIPNDIANRKVLDYVFNK